VSDPWLAVLLLSGTARVTMLCSDAVQSYMLMFLQGSTAELVPT
jgi:hypothetical protein